MEIKSKNISLKAILIIIGAGIWVIVLQNAGIIPTSQRVNVTNTVDVSGNVDVGNRVEVKGNVDVGEVDVNITGINGWEPANYYRYSLNGKEYHALGTN
jgi:hypothetical protein